VSAEDYETLLLRLVAEEGGYSRTFPPEAAERCRAEVGTAIPDLTLLDELAEVTIAIEPAAVSRIMAIEDEAPPFMPETGPELPFVYEPDSDSESDVDPGPVAGVPAKLPGLEPPGPKPAEPRPAEPSAGVPLKLPGLEPPEAKPAEPGPAHPPAGLPRPPAPSRLADRLGPPPPAFGPVPPTAPPASPTGPAAVPPPAKQAASAPSTTRCRFCAAALPSGRSVVFCPFCGHQLAVSRCPRCDTELEPGWRHCISCGLAMGPSRTGT
jgi:hypothetical protein